MDIFQQEWWQNGFVAVMFLVAIVAFMSMAGMFIEDDMRKPFARAFLASLFGGPVVAALWPVTVTVSVLVLLGLAVRWAVTD